METSSVHLWNRVPGLVCLTTYLTMDLVGSLFYLGYILDGWIFLLFFFNTLRGESMVNVLVFVFMPACLFCSFVTCG